MNVPTQPEVNIGLIGHVDHGKTTLAKALTGEITDRHSEEVKRGISIRLGYADVPIYECPSCEEGESFCTSPKCPKCNSDCEYARSVSFVDAPGHETLMATMLSGAALMNGALLLIAANEKCPQPQTREHLMAIEIMGVKNIIVVQNKIDLVTKEQALKSYQEIREFLRGTTAENAPIIPVSAHHDVNIDKLLDAIQRYIKTPAYDEKKPFRMQVARSFDVNKPGVDPEDLRGGVIGGSLSQGEIALDDEIEVLPGVPIELGGRGEEIPLRTKVSSLYAGGSGFEKVGPGGLIAIGTYLDPSLTKSDSLVGRLAGKPGTLPKVVKDFTMRTYLLKRVVGLVENVSVESVKTNEPLMLSAGTATTVGVVKSGREDVSQVSLKIPICAEKGHRIAISRRIAGKWRLIGYGILE
ncbi:MAG: translation initiation factor IF-2 subunit gamma [Thermoplasmata archaeon]|nr:translation initiation factor IF-2 subunit gamma [Thermoplasmata archaeon]